MSILDELSTGMGDRTQGANRAVAKKVEADLTLFSELVAGLGHSSDKLVGGCAERFAMTTEKHLQVAAPYISRSVPFSKARTKRIRWEATHIVSFAVRCVLDAIAHPVSRFMDAITTGKSVIVYDYTIKTLGEYASTSSAAAQRAYPHIVEVLEL